MKIICYRIIDQAQAEQPKKDKEASPNRVERWLKKREFLYTVCTGSTHSILRRRAPLLEPMFKQPLIWTYTKGTKAIFISDSACAHMRGCVRACAHTCACVRSQRWGKAHYQTGLGRWPNRLACLLPPGRCPPAGCGPVRGPRWRAERRRRSGPGPWPVTRTAAGGGGAAPWGRGGPEREAKPFETIE